MFFVENLKHQEFQVTQITLTYNANFLYHWCTYTECLFLSNLLLAGDVSNVAYSCHCLYRLKMGDFFIRSDSYCK